MFYSFILKIGRFLLLLLNGKTTVHNKHHLPDVNQGYILISPHRSWFDPLYLALAATPKKFCFMAKKELFKNPALRWFITKLNAFPVDRENPGPSAIKIPVGHLKEGQLGLIMFPSGTRHATDIKSGAATIARLAKVPIVPAVYQGPFSMSALLKRQPTAVNFGQPLYIQSKEDQENFGNIIQEIFDALDKEINPDFSWTPDQKK